VNKRIDPLIQEARVGIFWLLKNGKLVFDLTPISEAEPYGDCLTHPRGHLRQWETLQAWGFVPTETQYEELPRGRVTYQRQSAIFLVLADRCILASPAALKEIVATMHLPEGRTKFERDAHYRCSSCLSRIQLL